jgi:hypothetical protein
MKKATISIALLLVFFSCKKSELHQSDPVLSKVLNLLRDSLTGTDYAKLDRSSVSSYKEFIRIGFLNNTYSHFILLKTDDNGNIAEGRIIAISQLTEHEDEQGTKTFDGKIKISGLNGIILLESDIRNNRLLSSSSNAVGTYSLKPSNAPICSDCTLPEFITTTSYSGQTTNNAPFIGLYWIFAGSTGYYANVAGSGSGGGGGGNGTGNNVPDFLEIDFDFIDKAKVNPQQYFDCFSSISNSLATYTISISADLPVDGHPEIFFNWKDGSPGHAFITFTKGNPYDGSVSQSLGFYPNRGWKSIVSTNVISKIVDDGNHEYQATYIISVTTSEFESAISKFVANKDKSYNLSTYNCTDFALDVFKVVKTDFTIPMYAIPSNTIPSVPILSNTPEGLYRKIEELKNAGVPGASIGNYKQYASQSHGPCN